MESVFKILFIIVLNICFFILWKNKEKIEPKSFNIYNILYAILINKFAYIFFKTIFSKFEIFNEIGMYYIKVSGIDRLLNFLSLNLKKVNDILNLDKLFTIKLDILTIFIGLIAFITAIYIYILGVKSQIKKHILSYLCGHGNMFLLGFTLITMFLLGGRGNLLLGGISCLIWMLFRSINWIIKINSTSYFNENFSSILKEFRGERKNLKNGNQDVMDLLWWVVLSNSSPIFLSNFFEC